MAEDQEITKEIEEESSYLIQSPKWRNSTKRLVVTILVILALLGLYRIRQLIIPLILTAVLAYILVPIVDFLRRRTRLSKNAAIAVVYLSIAGLLIAVPASTIPQLITQGNNFLNNAPIYLEQIGGFLNQPLIMAGFVVPLDELPIDQVYSDFSGNLLSILQAIGPQGFTVFGRFASATITTVGWIVLVLFFSFYLVKDYQVLWGSIVALVPMRYKEDALRLGRETNGIWNAFLRGQLILGLVIAFATFISAILLGLPNAFLLGLLAGILEFIPNIGPIIAAIPAVLLALFQYEESWLGTMVGPLWFALIVLFVYAIIQRVENMYLVPRVIGRHLNLHPLIVLIGALIGASVAGVFGILLAAPLLATAKLILMYIYRKLLDQPPFYDLETAATMTADSESTGPELE